MSWWDEPSQIDWLRSQLEGRTGTPAELAAQLQEVINNNEHPWNEKSFAPDPDFGFEGPPTPQDEILSDYGLLDDDRAREWLERGWFDSDEEDAMLWRQAWLDAYDPNDEFPWEIWQEWYAMQ